MLRVGWCGRNYEDWVSANGKSKRIRKCDETACWVGDRAEDDGMHGYR